MLKDMSREEIELMSYTDLTYAILKEMKKPMTTPLIFKQICNLLEQSDEYFTDAIGDYYTSLVIDKRFVLLDSKEWDLRDNHSVPITLDEDEEELEETEDESEEDEIEEDVLEEEVFEDEVDDLDEDDDLDGLNIVPDEELEDN